MVEVKIGAMRGRNPDNPSERGKSNGKYQQRLEINEKGISNTITSVQKDNLVIELQNTAKSICLNSKVNSEQPSVDGANIGFKNSKKDGSLAIMEEAKVEQIGNLYPDKDGFKNRTSGRIYSSDGLSPTLRTVTGGHNEPKIVEHKIQTTRIRKLTPRECFRLMDCDDEIIDKIQEAGISNTQQYKLAGNSIVVNVLYHLFRKMFDDELSLF